MALISAQSRGDLGGRKCHTIAALACLTTLGLYTVIQEAGEATPSGWSETGITPFSPD
jgi:hypothetical protein